MEEFLKRRLKNWWRQRASRYIRRPVLRQETKLRRSFSSSQTNFSKKEQNQRTRNRWEWVLREQKVSKKRNAVKVRAEQWSPIFVNLLYKTFFIQLMRLSLKLQKKDESVNVKENHFFFLAWSGFPIFCTTSSFLSKKFRMMTPVVITATMLKIVCPAISRETNT